MSPSHKSVRDLDVRFEQGGDSGNVDGVRVGDSIILLRAEIV